MGSLHTFDSLHHGCNVLALGQAVLVAGVNEDEAGFPYGGKTDGKDYGRNNETNNRIGHGVSIGRYHEGYNGKKGSSSVLHRVKGIELYRAEFCFLPFKIFANSKAPGNEGRGKSDYSA